MESKVLSTFRVAKCHGYDGYIILAGWGKSLGEHAIWHNQAFLGRLGSGRPSAGRA